MYPKGLIIAPIVFFCCLMKWFLSFEVLIKNADGKKIGMEKSFAENKKVSPKGVY
jgi:hypothetical protein